MTIKVLPSLCSAGIALIAANAMLQQARAADLADDPFAQEVALDDEALSEARGGIAINGFVFEFGISTLLLVEGALIEGAPQEPLAITFDQSIGSLVINNVVDGATISRTVALDIHALNFNHVTSISSAALTAYDVTSVLYTAGLSGF